MERIFAFADKNTMVEYNMLDKEYDDFEDLFTEPDEDGTDNEECHEKDGNIQSGMEICHKGLNACCV